MKEILTSVNPPEYITHHMTRIVTTINDLQNQLPLNPTT